MMQIYIWCNCLGVAIVTSKISQLVACKKKRKPCGLSAKF